jgi:hypothetical protein
MMFIATAMPPTNTPVKLQVPDHTTAAQGRIALV